MHCSTVFNQFRLYDTRFTVCVGMLFCSYRPACLFIVVCIGVASRRVCAHTCGRVHMNMQYKLSSDVHVNHRKVLAEENKVGPYVSVSVFFWDRHVTHQVIRILLKAHLNNLCGSVWGFHL